MSNFKEKSMKVNDPYLSQLHKLFEETLQKEGKANSTIIAYTKDVEQLLNYLSETGITKLKNATLEDLKHFKTNLENEKYTPKSISRKINSIRTFYKIMRQKGIVTENPSSRLVHPKIEMTPPRVLLAMEYRSLRDVCRGDTRLYAIVELLLQTGIRISELAGLYLEDIRKTSSGKMRYLYIREHDSHPSRKVPLNGVAYKAIQEYIQIRPESDNDRLFITKTGRPLLIRNIRTAIDHVFEKAEIKNVKVNDLRNTFIAHHLANGVSLVTVAKIVGHKRLSTTEKYLGLIANKQSEEETELGNL